PLGVSAHLRRWGVPAERIIELDWHDATHIAGLRIVATPGRHFSGRAFVRNNTLWASWVLTGASHRLFYSGDTGYFDGFARIGTEYGPFDATLMQLGAYAPSWPDVHMTPEDAVAAHLDVGGGTLVPVHWGTFDLGPHGWSDPVDRARKEAAARGVHLVVPKPGERVDLADPPELDPWWEPLAWPVLRPQERVLRSRGLVLRFQERVLRIRGLVVRARVAVLRVRRRAAAVGSRGAAQIPPVSRE